MEKLLNLLFISAFVIVFDMSQIMNELKMRLDIGGRIKPFDCVFCLSFWTALAYLYFMGGDSLVISVGYASLTCLFTVWIYKRIVQ